MTKKTYLGQVDQGIYTDFRAAVRREHGASRVPRGRSFVALELEKLMTQYIVRVNQDLPARARDSDPSEEDKYDDLLLVIKTEGITKATLPYTVYRIWGCKDKRTQNAIFDRFLHARHFSSKFIELFRSKKWWEIGATKKVSDR